MGKNLTNKKIEKYEDLVELLSNLSCEGKNITKSIDKAACSVLCLKSIRDWNSEKLDNIFIIISNKFGKDASKVYIRLFEKIFYKSTTDKYYNALNIVLRAEIEKIFEDKLESKALNHIISDISTLSSKQFLHAYIEKFSTDEMPVIYVYLMLKVKLIHCRQDKYNEAVLIVQRIFAEELAKVNKNDKYYLKPLIRAWMSKKECDIFAQETYLYDGCSEKIENLEKKNNKLNDSCKEKQNRIRELCGEVEELETTKRILEGIIQSKETEVESLKKEITKAHNKNEFDENLYQQQFLTLKSGLIESIKHDLNLEIQGLVDIAEHLDEKMKAKILRRIENIFAIISHIGD